MHQLEHHLALIREREAHLRSIRVPERAAQAPARPIRSRLGGSLMRLGRWVAGDSLTPPVWTG